MTTRVAPVTTTPEAPAAAIVATLGRVQRIEAQWQQLAGAAVVRPVLSYRLRPIRIVDFFPPRERP